MKDQEYSFIAFCGIIAIGGTVLIAIIMAIGINYHHATTSQADLDAIKVRAGVPTSDLESRVIRLEKALGVLSNDLKEFRPIQ
jgi:hypothetical protein